MHDEHCAGVMGSTMHTSERLILNFLIDYKMDESKVS